MSNEYLDWKQDHIEANKALVQKYPFLKLDDSYECTATDDIPIGWWNAFGEQMCNELMDVLGDYASEFEILQIKEKYGALRVYHGKVPNDIYDKVYDVIKKYEEISYEVCVYCGKPATSYSTGWILPMCDECCVQK